MDEANALSEMLKLLTMAKAGHTLSLAKICLGAISCCLHEMEATMERQKHEIASLKHQLREAREASGASKSADEAGSPSPG